MNEINQLENMLENLQKQLKATKLELRKMPDGNLQRRSINGKFSYYVAYSSKSRKNPRAINKYPDLIAALCRKAFLEQQKKYFQNNILLLKNIIVKFTELSPDAIINNLPSRFNNLPTDYFFNRNQKRNPAAEWLNASYNQADYKENEKTHITSWGLRVRSKSEVLIAEQLHINNIAFHYEEILSIGSRKIIPDFTIKKSDGGLIYWEHSGLTSNIT